MQHLGFTESNVKPKDIVVDDYSVWLAKNIKETTKTDEDNNEVVLYTYDLTRYDLKEYLELSIAIQNTDITDMKMAIADLSILIAGGNY